MPYCHVRDRDRSLQGREAVAPLDRPSVRGFRSRHQKPDRKGSANAVMRAMENGGAAEYRLITDNFLANKPGVPQSWKARYQLEERAPFRWSGLASLDATLQNNSP